MGRPSTKPFPTPPELKLPNEGSRCQTPASLQTDLRYAQLHIWKRMTWERYVRLAAFLNVTPAELASIVCVPHRALESFERRNHLYNGHAADRAAALLLTLLESHVAKEFTQDVIENPLPDLSKIHA